MARHNILGKEGERAAREFLIARGMTIRETNWRCGHLEVDIIAQKDSLIHIVEVKTRSTQGAYEPLASIDKRKILNLVNAANMYVRYNRLRMEVQFDVMVLYGHDGHFEITYMPKAFLPPLKTYR